MNNKSIDELVNENARLRGDLLTISSRISHDLRTPLGGILNNAELLKEIFVENDFSSAPLDPLFKSVDEMMRLIKSTSLIAKASANPAPVKNVKMRDAVYHAWQRLERQILKREATVKMADAWPEVLGVTEWLEFIWCNFLSNALEHGGKKIEVGWRQENSGNKFFVRDDGLGVPAKLRAKLFQPFDQLHQPDSAHGLGLSMTRRLVELQGGRCGYEAEGGPCLYFTLPKSKT
jgi:signal transduction histidine kinase